MRLIDAEPLRDKYAGTPPELIYSHTVATDIDAAPTIDPVRHGHWIGRKYEYTEHGHPTFGAWECSVCGCESEGFDVPWDFLFCPYCGARVDGYDDA